jgi:hemerythrin-like domain-containing protein
MKATEILIHEHDLILRGIGVLERMARIANGGTDLPAGDARAIIEFIRQFADGCHHAKEEGVLFPAMEAAGIPNQGGPIGMMLMEHDQGRAAVRRMDEAVSAFGTGPAPFEAFAQAAFEYSALLSTHIFKENNVLFRMADQRIPTAQDAVMLAAYDEHEAKANASGAYARYQAVVEGLEAIYAR